MRYPFRRWLLPLILVLVSLVIVSGCGKSGTTPSSAPGNTQAVTGAQSSQSADPSGNGDSNSTGGETQNSVKVKLYFPKSDASGLVAVERTLSVSDDAIIKSMIAELQNPPSGLDNPIPKGTKLLEATVNNGVATLDFSKEFQKNFNGGSSGEQMTLYSIIDTLTTLPDVQSVQFLLEGQTLDAILGNTDTTQPLKPDLSLIQK